MKRSEMIECMVNHWLGAFSGFEKLADDELKEDIRDDTYENMAKLLALLEYKGILPPREEKDKHCGCDKTFLECRNCNPQWEPE